MEVIWLLLPIISLALESLVGKTIVAPPAHPSSIKASELARFSRRIVSWTSDFGTEALVTKAWSIETIYS